MTSTGVAHFHNSKLPLPVKPVRLGENRIMVANNKCRSQSVSTWQQAPGKIEIVPKTRHLSVREDGSFLGRRNSHKETMTRLKPSFGPNGVNGEKVDHSSHFNRKVEMNHEKDLSKEPLKKHQENIPINEMENSKDDSKTKSRDVLLEIHLESKSINDILNSGHADSSNELLDATEEDKHTNIVKRNKDAPLSKQIQKQSSFKPYSSSVGDNIDPEDSLYEYSSEIVTYLKSREKKFISPPDFLVSRQVSHPMRSLLADWLIQCQHHLKFCQETLYLAISILDHVLSVLDVEAGQLQLVGVTSLLLASKLEEYYPAEMTKLTYLTEQSYTVSQILRMEMTILRLVEFQLHYPDPMVFLKRFTLSANLLEDDMFCKTCQLLMDSYIVTKEYPSTPPSVRAAGSVMGALQLYKAVNKGCGRWTDTLKRDSGYSSDRVAPVALWTDTLKRDSGYSSDEVAPVALDMLDEVWKAATVEEYKYKGAYVKYKSNSLHKRLVLQEWLRPQVIAKAKEELKCLIN